jgi:hypothetical protein
VESEPLLQDGSELLLIHGWFRRATANTPEVLLANLLARAVQFDESARPQQVDALYGAAWADHETVPYTAGDGLRIKSRGTQQPRGQKGAELGGEGHGPPCVGIP